jgi:hypothetical protein
VRRELAAANLRSKGLRDPSCRHDFSELHVDESRQDLSVEVIRVNGPFQVDLCPFLLGSLPSGDRSTPSSSQLRRLSRIGGNALVAPDMTRVRHWPAAV